MHMHVFCVPLCVIKATGGLSGKKLSLIISKDLIMYLVRESKNIICNLSYFFENQG